MNQTAAAVAPTLVERLNRGADLLFEMEQRGDTGSKYGRWLRQWLDLLQQYEQSQEA